MGQIIGVRINKNEDTLQAIVRWEVLLSVLARDFKEELSEKMRIAFRVKALPASLGDRLMGQLGRLTTYKEVHDNVVNLVQASSE